MSIPRDVKKAVELVRAHPERDVSLPELAAACCVAPRTLSACGPNEANDPKPTLAEGARNTG